ncbi:MAG: hypothetical protein WA786_06830 [Acidimicrobiales bacterium]
MSVASASEHGSRLSNHDGFAKKANWADGADGVVTVVSATSVTIMGHGGTSSTFAITTATTFTEGTTTVLASALVVGSHVDIQVSTTTPGTAASIDIKASRPIRLGGLVSAVTPTSVTVTGRDGTSVIYTITTATTFSEGSTTVLASALVVGSRVEIQVSSSALTTATSIDIKAPEQHMMRLGGAVTAVTPTSVTVTGRDGTSVIYTITTATTFTEGTTTVLAAALVVGDHVDIQVSSTAPTTATSIEIALARVSGKVTAVSGDDITVTDHHGNVSTIVVSPTTTYTKGGATAASTDVVVGVFVSAQGTIGATPATLDATSVSIGSNCGSSGGAHIATGHLSLGSRSFGGGQGGHGFGGRGSHSHGNFRR